MKALMSFDYKKGFDAAVLILQNPHKGQAFNEEVFQQLTDALKENEELKKELANKDTVRLWNENEHLKAKLDRALKFMNQLDQYFCERIIDPCGYDPEQESREDLKFQVIVTSWDNEVMLKILKATLKDIEGMG